ncbi:MAG: hypothetical protein ACE5JL_08585 [Dehalococcoidia bacterium]
MKRMRIVDRRDRLEVNFKFPDCRLVDLEITLHHVARENRWSLSRDGGIGEAIYRVSLTETFMATARFTHGLEPPTWAIFENKPPDQQNYWRAAKRSTLQVAKAFLKECADRGLITDRARDEALKELDQHDHE